MQVKDSHKRLKYIVISELLRRGFDLFLNPLDEQDIDCIIRLNENTYAEIQIKTKSSLEENWHTFAAMSITPRDNKIMIFYIEKDNSYWIIPTQELLKVSRVKHLGRITFSVPTDDSLNKLSVKYKNDMGFNLIKNMDKL